MKRYLAFSIIVFAFVALATAAFAAVPASGTACGVSVQRWICAPATPAGKPAGWYTPSSAIPAGKTIYKSCSMKCASYHPMTGACTLYVPTFVARANHANDVVLSSGARRAYCGSSTSHAVEYWTFP